MRLPLVALMLPAVLLSCGRERFSGVNSDVSVETRELDFGDWSVGASRMLPLIITNHSRISEVRAVSVEGPFSAPPSVELGGGQQVELQVAFAPLAMGPQTGRLLVGEVEVSLRGVGLQPDACVPADCVVRTLDPATGHCVESAAADGTACGSPSACVVDGVCLRGACLGAPPSCDDRNPCTGDACEPGVGCVHSDSSASCPAPGDPCHAASCDPVTGCGSVAVADGTPCGEVSCAVANVCMQGACRALTPPDGFTCAPASPCKGEGHCHAQQCVQPALPSVPAAWTYFGAAAASVIFQGVADERLDALFWLECQPSGTAGLVSCEAVSFTGAGLPRFRTALPGAFAAPASMRLQLFDAGRFVAALGDTLFAVDGASGRLLWSSSLAAVAGPAAVQQLASSPDGAQLWALLGRFVRGGPVSVLVRVDAATGAVRGAQQTPGTAGYWSGLVVDATGNGWTTLSAAPGPQLQSFDATGALRFGVPVPSWSAAWPVSTAGGALVTSDDGVFSAASGATLHAAVGPDEGTRYLESLQLPGARYRVFREDQLATTTLLVDGGTPLAMLRQTHAGPFATADGSLLLATGSWAGFDLTLLSPQGQPRFSCPAEATYQAVSGTAAFTGRYLALITECAVCAHEEWELQVYDVGALGTAPSGWVAPNGTAGAAGHPR